jgi:hypothetical protein
LSERLFIPATKKEVSMISVSEHLTDSELHQVMSIVGTALDRAKDQGIIKGDPDNLELSIEASIPEV